jgi:hypothetical protein
MKPVRFGVRFRIGALFRLFVTLVKYRFLEETPLVPAAATFPLVHVPSGSSTQGLGNGKTPRLPDRRYRSKRIQDKSRE